jgi:ABC-type multidrug transport system fused ATPase/permease subunit
LDDTAAPLPPTLYRYVWQASRTRQLKLLAMTAIIAPLGVIPLEMQRRIVDTAVAQQDLHLLFWFCGAYLAILLIYGGLKYVLNLEKGAVLEEVTLDLRTRALGRLAAGSGAAGSPAASAGLRGTALSVVSMEAEEIGNFASDGLSLPMLQGGTIAWTLGYLIWVQPEVAIIAAVVYLPQIILVPKIQAEINRLSRRRTVFMRALGQSAVDAAGHHRVVNRPRRHAHAGVLARLIFRMRMMIYRKKFFLTFLGNFLDSLGPLLILLVGGWLVIQGQAQIGTLVVFISGFHRIAEPWSLLVNFWRSVSNMGVVYDLIRRAVAAPPPLPR